MLLLISSKDNSYMLLTFIRINLIFISGKLLIKVNKSQTGFIIGGSRSLAGAAEGEQTHADTDQTAMQ